jgi:beta-phosphoglucomutase-like phosphatase (HAD superfamily)
MTDDNAGLGTVDSPLDTQVRLADLRLRVLNNQPVSPAEYRDLLMDLRRHRVGAAAASSKARRAAAKVAAPINLADLFGATHNAK